MTFWAHERRWSFRSSFNVSSKEFLAASSATRWRSSRGIAFDGKVEFRHPEGEGFSTAVLSIANTAGGNGAKHRFDFFGSEALSAVVQWTPYRRLATDQGRGCPDAPAAKTPHQLPTPLFKFLASNWLMVIEDPCRPSRKSTICSKALPALVVRPLHRRRVQALRSSASYLPIFEAGVRHFFTSG